MDDVLFVIMTGDPTVVVLKAVDEVFPSSVVDADVKETGIRIPLFEQLNSRTLSFPGSLKNRQGHHLLFEVLPQIPFSQAECPGLLSHVEAKDDLEAQVELHFVM